MSNSNTKKNEQQGKYKKQQQQLKKKTAAIRAKKSNASKQSAKKSFASAPVGKSINQCPSPTPVPPLAIAKKPENVTRQNCSLIRIDTICEHKGRRAKDNLLQVVPSTSRPATYSTGGDADGFQKNVKIGFELSIKKGDDNEGDNLTMKAEMHQNCGSHPIWKIKDDKNSLIKEQIGENISFEVLPTKFTDSLPYIIGMFLWLRDIEPRRYILECTDHNGGLQQTNIDVYPAIESGFSVKIGSVGIVSKKVENKLGEKREEWDSKNKEREKKRDFWIEVIKALRGSFTNWEKAVTAFTPNVKTLEIKILEGSFSAKNTWAEKENSNRAYWEGEIAFNLEPLISICGELAITPTFIPPYINKWVDAYFFISLQGEITTKGFFKWKDGENNQLGSAVNGAITGLVGAKAFVGKGEYKIIALEVNGGTKLSFEGGFTGTIKPQASLEGKLLWDPLIAKVSIQAADGLITLVKKDWVFFEQVEIWSGKHDFLSS